MNKKQFGGLIGIIIIVSASLLAVFRILDWKYFWYVAAGMAIFAWWVLPTLE